MRLHASRPVNMDIRVRIPAWSPNPSLSVNGKPVPVQITAGFASLRRTWHDGDSVLLKLALPMRLESIDDQHSDTVALMMGPLVLFPIGENPTSLTRAQLLTAARLPEVAGWQVNTQAGPLKLLPFSEIKDEPYSTYVTVT